MDIGFAKPLICNDGILKASSQSKAKKRAE